LLSISSGDKVEVKAIICKFCKFKVKFACYEI